MEGWVLNTQSQRRLADGVCYLEYLFLDENGLPHRVYVLTVDPEKATLYTGTSQNGYELIPKVQQNVQQQMEASVADGINVIAAVNGDFFAINASYMPAGLSIKNGVVIHPNTSFRPYSAITKNGDFLISDAKGDEINPNTLQMAVGGSHVIVKQAQVYKELVSDPHPRTISGVKKDGTIILAVIDGRQPHHSNGATLVQCAQLMCSLGAQTAINHDGGGSSTMILRSDNQYETVNSPSDGNLRAIYCSIQIIEKAKD